MKKVGAITDPEYNEACKKIAVHPGYVYSPSDGDRHWIGFKDICRICGINPMKAHCWDTRRPETFEGRRMEDYHHVYASDMGLYHDFSKPVTGRFQSKVPNESAKPRSL